MPVHQKIILNNFVAGIATRQADSRPVVQCDAGGRPGKAGDEGGLAAVVKVEHEREIFPGQCGCETQPPGRAERHRENGIHIGIHGRNVGVSALHENGQVRLWPMPAQAPEDGTEENDVAEITAANHKDAGRGLR